jgi:RNA recognition motif-containing protein
VDRVNLMTDRDTGHSRSFAFVDMADSAEADRAIADLNNAALEGRTLIVSEARPQGPCDAPLGDAERRPLSRQSGRS